MKFDKRKRFAIRKISVGVASVLVGLFFVGSMVNAPQVNASELKSEEGVEVNKGVEERSTKEVTSEEISVPEPYRAPATFVAPTTENDSTVVSTTESTTEVTVKETEKTTVAIAPSTAPLAEKKAELKVDEKEVPETEAKPEVDAILQPLKEQLNNSILEAKAVNQEAEKQEAKLDDSESKKVLSDALQASKAELVVAQQLSEKAQLTKADLELSIGRLQSAIESVYTEMKRSGHSGFVSYMLADNASTPSDGKTPYMTIENYSGFHTLIHNGTTVEVRYKMGLTRITSDEVELSQGAKDLGLTYDPVGEYVYGTLNLNGGIPSGTYDIGLVSKTNPNVKATLPLTITKPHSYALSTLSNDRFDLSASKANDYYDQATGDMGENNTRVNKYTIPTTPFGYYLTPGYSDNTPVTVADAKPDTPKYNTELGLYVADDSRVTAFPSTPVLLERIERLDTTPEVEYELAVTGDPYGKFYSDENWMVHDPNRTPYRLRFTKLPAQQGTFTIKFKTIDKLGQERIFNVELTTEERSKATTDDANGFYLTNADVKFTPNTKTAVLNKEGIVSVPRSDKEQTIGKIELNKVNAKVKPVRFPDGTEYDEATQTIKKKAGVKLAPGKYNFEVRAIDGHFGDNAPNRVFQFEVTDVISPIDHQVWKEGEKFPSIPVTLEGGSTIANIRVTTNSGDTYATVSSDNITKTLEGYGVLQTTENKTARVEVDYYNADGGISTTFTTFTFEVKPRDGIGVDLDVTNHEQTIKEGEKFKDMVITHTDGATLKVDTAALPKGTRYNKATKTIAGKGLVEGTYRIKVIAEKDGQAVQKYVTLTVLPGPLHAENYTREVTVGDEIDPIEIAIPNRAEFSGDIRGELGLNYDYNTKILSGTTNSVGTKTYTYKLKRGLEEATGTITITVKPRPITVNSGEQTVEVGTPITNFVIQPSERADIGYIRYGTFEAGIQNLPSGLTYDPDTKTISGTPTSVGEFTVNYIAYYKGLENDTAQGTFKLTVTKKPIQVTGGETEVQVLTKMTPVKVEASEGATISVDLNDYSKPSNPLTGKYPSILPEGVTYDESTHTFSGTPKKLGIYRIPVKARYENFYGNDQADGEVVIKVTESPVAIEISNKEQTVTVGDAITPAVVTHNNLSTVTMKTPYGLVEESEINAIIAEYGLTYDPATKTFTGTPTKAGTFTIRMQATNAAEVGGASAIDTFTLTVNPKAEKGLDLKVSGGRQLVQLGKAITDITLTHTPGSELTLDETSLPAGVTFDAATKTISGTPTAVGSYTAKATATLDGKSVSKDVIIDVVDIKDGKDGKDGKSPVVTVKDNEDGTHTVKVVNPDGTTTETVIKNGKDGKTPTVTVKDNQDGTHTVKVVNPNGTTTETVIKNGKDGKTPTVTVKDNQDGTHTVKVVNPDGETTETIIKDGKNPSVTTKRGEDSEGNTGTWVITHDPAGTETGRTFVKDGKDGKDGKSPVVTVKDNEDGTHTVKVVNPDGTTTETVIKNSKDGKTPTVTVKDNQDGTHTVKVVNPDGETTETIIKDGKNPSVTTKRGEDSEGNTGTWVITHDPAGTETGRTFVKDGKDGKDGKSPVVTVKDNEDGTHTVKVVNPDGTTTETVIKNGKDGKTPTVTVKDNQDGTHTVKVVNPGGETTETIIKDGKNPSVTTERGEDSEGNTGTWVITHDPAGTETGRTFVKDGKDGKDGKSPVVTVKDNQDGTHTVKVVNPDGTTTETVIKNGKDGKTPTVTVKDNQDGTHTVKVVNPDGETTETIIKDGKNPSVTTERGEDSEGNTGTWVITHNPAGTETGRTFVKDGKDGKDGKTPVVTVKDNQDGTHTVKVVNPDGTTTETVIKNGKDGKTPTVTVKDNQDGTHTVKVVNPDGETTETIIKDGKNPSVTTERGEDSEGNTGTWVITHNPAGTETGRTFVKDGKDGKDGKTPTITIESGKDEEGRSGVWVIVRDSEGNITSRNFIRDGKDGKTPKVRTESGKDKEGNTGVWVITEDGDGKETSRTFVRDGKDGKTPSITTEPGKNKEGQSGYWIIIKDGEGKETNRIFIRDCGCPKKEDPKPKPQPDPKPQPQPDPKPQPQPDPKPQPQPDPKPQPQPDPKPQPQPDPKPQPQPDPKPQPQSDPKPQPQPDPKPQLQSDPKPQPQPDPKPQPQLPPQPIEDKVIPINKFRNGEPQKELPNTGTEELPFLSLAAFIGLASAGFALSQKKREED